MDTIVQSVRDVLDEVADEPETEDEGSDQVAAEPEIEDEGSEND